MGGSARGAGRAKPDPGGGKGRGGMGGAGGGPRGARAGVARAALAALLASRRAAGAAGNTGADAWSGQAGEDLQAVPVGLPGGGSVDIHFWGTPKVLPERVPGVLDFELFPPADAKALVDIAEAWSKHEKGWSDRPDTVDKLPEWQINLLEDPPLREDSRPPRLGANVGLKTAMLPLTKRICLGMLTKFLATHRVATDKCSSVFMRKYDAAGRPNIPTHQDQSVFTLNVALSDYREVEGGELFMCKQMPQSYAQILMSVQDFLPDGKPPPEDRDPDAENMWRWFPLVYPYSRIAQSIPETPDVCMKAQGAQGHAVSAFGGRMHGVFPTQAGTRYSMIFFIGEAKDLKIDDDTLAEAKSFLAEPFGESHVTNLESGDMMTWLIYLSSMSTRCGLGQLSFEDNVSTFQSLLNDGSSIVYAIRDVTLVLKHFSDNGDLASLALRSMHSMLVGEEMPHEIFRRVALETGAVEFVLRVVAAHPHRYDISQLGCAVWENLSCGGLEGEECEGRTEECEDPELFGPLEIDEAWHGTRPYEEDELDDLMQRCSIEAQQTEAQGAPIDPDCFLLYALEMVRNPPVELPPEMIEKLNEEARVRELLEAREAKLRQERGEL